VYYRIIWIVTVFLGSVAKLSMIWDLADSMNALMAIPNLVSLILLSGVLASETKKYLWSGRLDDMSN
jgi:AGCS family alanine or glycine:cation symporter